MTPASHGAPCRWSDLILFLLTFVGSYLQNAQLLFTHISVISISQRVIWKLIFTFQDVLTCSREEYVCTCTSVNACHREIKCTEVLNTHCHVTDIAGDSLCHSHNCTGHTSGLVLGGQRRRRRTRRRTASLWPSCFITAIKARDINTAHKARVQPLRRRRDWAWVWRVAHIFFHLITLSWRQILKQELILCLMGKRHFLRDT